MASICLEGKEDTNLVTLAAQIRARIQKDNMEHSAAVERIEQDCLKKEKKGLGGSDCICRHVFSFLCFWEKPKTCFISRFGEVRHHRY